MTAGVFPGAGVYLPTCPGPDSNAFCGADTEKLDDGFNWSCTSYAPFASTMSYRAILTSEAETAKLGFLSSAIAMASCSEMPTKGCCVTPTICAALGAACGAL